ncbi:phosphoglycerate mutase family protein [uncultured Algibacter sp.]|uniref:phosphoglycerate mutase family protein n=1 Tax=uncultured Algibacter sp. TaxID=298659 RepID=UPI00260F099A|nr:phosphoglycerate mutase family protein [uncultured Algibacter sp.]
MKNILVLLILLITYSSFSQNDYDTKTSNYYFIRHAEKDKSDSADRNPHLTDKGHLRAQKWAEVFKNISFDAIYSTDFFRTRETALPSASKDKIELTIYNHKSLKIEKFLKETKGKNVLVVGHSNSTPSFVNSILKKNKYKEIEHSNNGNLYIVTVNSNVVTDKLLLIN